MDRTELIKALGNAFSDNPGKGEITQVETASAGEKTVLRLTKTNNSDFALNMQTKYNDLGIIDTLISQLSASGDRDGEQAAIYWKAAYAGVINKENEERLSGMIESAHDILRRLSATSPHTAQRNLVYLVAMDALK